MKEKHVLMDLFFSFAKIGLFTFGGGYAMISIIEDLFVERKKWLTHEEMMNLTVVAESTPGPIAVNCATYLGYSKAGIPGAALATFGVVLPSFVIIYLISLFLDNFLDITIVANAFKGIKIGVGLVIVQAGINLMKQMKKGILPKAFLFCAFTALLLINIFSWNFSSAFVMMIGGALSLLIYVAGKRKDGEKI